MKPTSYLLQPWDGCVGIGPNECTVPVPNGFLVFPTYASEPDGVSYVRFTDKQGVEQAYWISDEWTETPEQGREVMGAILGAITHGPRHINDAPLEEESK